MKKQKKLQVVYRRKLFAVYAVILGVSIILIGIIVPLMISVTTSATLRSQINEISKEIDNELDAYFSVKFSGIGEVEITPEYMEDMKSVLGCSHWSYIDGNGVVLCSDVKSRTNTNASQDPVLEEFRARLLGTDSGTYYSKRLTAEDLGSESWTKYVGCSLGQRGILVLEYESSAYYSELDYYCEPICNVRTVGAKGFDIILRQSGEIVSAPELDGENQTAVPKKANINTLLSVKGGKDIFTIHFKDTAYYGMYVQADGYYAAALIPQSEVTRNITVLLILFAVLVGLLLTIILLRVNSITSKLIVRNIEKINTGLSEITEGDLDVEIDVRDNVEFNRLSDGINTTVAALKRSIKAESERLEKELALAHSIQTSALPNVFPPFPERHDIDIFALMTPAKQVGGDFYDFFFADNDRFVFLVADVSDKGIPAAMFMMKAKTIIKSLAEANRNIDEVIFNANNVLCAENSADMFVTLWFGALDTETGSVSFVNAGHCKPLVRHADGSFEYICEPPDFVLAGYEDIRYKQRKLILAKGDALFLYTDGVTEAVNADDDIYGEDRLRGVLNALPADGTAKEICDGVFSDVKAYSDGVVQSDDITMLSVVFNGCRVFKEITVEARLERLEPVYVFLENMLAETGFDSTSVAKIGVIADEICANIVRYAYPGKTGSFTVSFSFDPADDEAEITFTDSGIPFNPLNVPIPDAENVEEREEGGFGIFLVKKFSDRLFYVYSEEKNHLTIVKKRQSE